MLQEYFLNLVIQHELPLAMVGPSGTGKTFITSGLIEGLSTEKFTGVMTTSCPQDPMSHIFFTEKTNSFFT